MSISRKRSRLSLAVSASLSIMCVWVRAGFVYVCNSCHSVSNVDDEK